MECKNRALDRSIYLYFRVAKKYFMLKSFVFCRRDPCFYFMVLEAPRVSGKLHNCHPFVASVMPPSNWWIFQGQLWDKRKFPGQLTNSARVRNCGSFPAWGWSLKRWDICSFKSLTGFLDGIFHPRYQKIKTDAPPLWVGNGGLVH